MIGYKHIAAPATLRYAPLTGAIALGLVWLAFKLAMAMVNVIFFEARTLWDVTWLR